MTMFEIYDATDSDTDNESLYSENSEEDQLDAIYKHDYNMLKYKQNKKNYIGLAALVDDTYLLSHTVTPVSFFKYSYSDVVNYLHNYSIIYVNNPKIDIFQLHINRDYYNVILKTYWIRLIQRHWKKICKENTEKMRRQRNWDIHKISKIKGMLAPYALLNVNKYKN
jgi:hypothetical protein